MFHEPAPEQIPSGRAGVDVVVDATGRFRARGDAGKHLRDGVRKVLITANGRDEDWTVVYSVNDADYDPARHHIVSAGSCTTNCVTPVAKLLHDRFGVRRASITTVHSYTITQNLLDGGHKDWRRARAAAHNIIPTTTGAADAVAKLIPELAGKLDGVALRVPTSAVSLVDLVAEVERPVTVEAVNEVVRAAVKDPMQGVLYVDDEPLVSIDYAGHPGLRDRRRLGHDGDRRPAREDARLVRQRMGLRQPHHRHLRDVRAARPGVAAGGAALRPAALPAELSGALALHLPPRRAPGRTAPPDDAGLLAKHAAPTTVRRAARLASGCPAARLGRAGVAGSSSTAGSTRRGRRRSLRSRRPLLVHPAVGSDGRPDSDGAVFDAIRGRGPTSTGSPAAASPGVRSSAAIRASSMRTRASLRRAATPICSRLAPAAGSRAMQT